MLHCDLKPNSIMICKAGSPDETAVVIDFGVSVLLGNERSVSATLHVAGALDYLAPEQFGGHLSFATDVYSLGAVLFEMLTGVRWLQAKRMEDIERLLAGMPMPSGEEVPERLAESFRRATAQDRQKRLTSIADLETQLGLQSAQ